MGWLFHVDDCPGDSFLCSKLDRIGRRQQQLDQKEMRRTATHDGVKANRRADADLKARRQLVDGWAEPRVDLDELFEPPPGAAHLVQRHGSADEIALAQLVEVGAQAQSDPACQPLEELRWCTLPVG